MRVAFITNNASRPPEAVAEHLRELGVEAGAGRRRDLGPGRRRGCSSERLGAGARVVVLGGRGLADAVAEAGLVQVGVEDDAEAVVTGYGPDVLLAARSCGPRCGSSDGLWWVASNTDLTIPTTFGVAPGHGVLVETLRRFTGVEPVVAGKPARPLLDETVRRCGGERPLMVGDRLDTDIEGAHAAGVDSLLVMTGVTGLAELVAAGPGLRPTYISADLGGLDAPQPVPEVSEDAVSLGGWRGRVSDGALEMSGAGRGGRLVAGRGRGGVAAPRRRRRAGRDRRRGGAGVAFGP